MSAFDVEGQRSPTLWRLVSDIPSLESRNRKGAPGRCPAMLLIHDGCPTSFASNPFHRGGIRPARLRLFLRFQRFQRRPTRWRVHDLFAAVRERMQPDSRVRGMHEQRGLRDAEPRLRRRHRSLRGVRDQCRLWHGSGLLPRQSQLRAGVHHGRELPRGCAAL